MKVLYKDVNKGCNSLGRTESEKKSRNLYIT